MGVYYVDQAINVKEAIEEAEFILQNLEKLYCRKRFSKKNVTVWIDVCKIGGRGERKSKSYRTKIVATICKKVASAGYLAGIYTQDSCADELLNEEKLARYYFWTESLGNDDGSMNQPIPVHRHDLWHYTTKYNIGSEYVNMSIVLDEKLQELFRS